MQKPTRIQNTRVPTSHEWFEVGQTIVSDPRQSEPIPKSLTRPSSGRGSIRLFLRIMYPSLTDATATFNLPSQLLEPPASPPGAEMENSRAVADDDQIMRALSLHCEWLQAQQVLPRRPTHKFSPA